MDDIGEEVELLTQLGGEKPWRVWRVRAKGKIQ